MLGVRFTARFNDPISLYTVHPMKYGVVLDRIRDVLEYQKTYKAISAANPLTTQPAVTALAVGFVCIEEDTLAES